MMDSESKYLGQEVNRGRVDRFKQIIQEKEVFSLSGAKRDRAAAEVVGSLNITGVTTIEGMLEKTLNGTVNREVAMKNILDLGTAIGECALASGDEGLKKAMLAGSFSTEILLPKPWQGRLEGDVGDVGLAGVACDSFTDKISDSVKREKVVGVMEAVDFYKNNSEFSALLLERINWGIGELGNLVNPLKGSEMKIISERLKYLQSERVRLSSRGSAERKIHSDDEGPEHFEPERPEPPSFDDGDGEGRKKGRGGFSYGPEFDRFAIAVIRGLGSDLRVNSPPKWFNETERSNQIWYETAHYLAQCSEYKTAMKDSVKGTEKLWLDDNYRTKLNESELKIMYERQGFRIALQKFVTDLCVLKTDESNGSEFLYLRPEKDADGKALVISHKLLDIDTYKQEMAMSLCAHKAYSGKGNNRELFSREISQIMSSRGLNREQSIEVWKKVHNFDEAQIEVGTAWNFLYNCDFVESADFSRQLGPIDGVKGDAANFIFHPDAKVSSKLTDEKLAEARDEIKGGPLALWYEHQLKYDKDFRAEYERGGDARLFPRRLGVGFLDTYSVETNMGKMSMARALMEGATIDFSKRQASKSNIFKDYKDMREGALVTFKFLTGQMPLDGKNQRQWGIEIKNAISLLHQQGKMPDGKKLPILDDVRLYAAIIYGSGGVNPSDKLLTLRFPVQDYREAIRQLCLESFVACSNSDLNVSPKSGVLSKFQKEVFDFVYKGSAKRGFYDLFGKR